MRMREKTFFPDFRGGKKKKRPERKPRGAFTRPANECVRIKMFDEGRYSYPTLRITAEAHGKMRALIEACPIEVSWLATCTRRGKGDITIDNIFVPHQRCTSGSTVISPDGEQQLLSELYGCGLRDAINRLDCWGHSHVWMQVFASGTDDQQTNDFLDRAEEMKKDFFVRLIANKRDDLYASIYLLDRGVIVHHCPIIAEPAETGRWRKWAARQIRLKVRRERIMVQAPPKGYVAPSFVMRDPERDAQIAAALERAGMPVPDFLLGRDVRGAKVRVYRGEH